MSGKFPNFAADFKTKPILTIKKKRIMEKFIMLEIAVKVNSSMSEDEIMDNLEVTIDGAGVEEYNIENHYEFEA